MGTKVKVSTSSDFENRLLMSDDKFILAKVVGYKESKAINTFNQKEEDYITIEFDVIDKNVEFFDHNERKVEPKDETEIRKTWTRCRKSLHPKSNLYEYFCKVTGRKLEPNEEVDLDEILNKKCLLLLTTKDKINPETKNEYKSQFVSKIKSYSDKTEEKEEPKPKSKEERKEKEIEVDDAEESTNLLKQIKDRMQVLVEDDDSKKQLKKVLTEHDCLPIAKIREVKVPVLKMILAKLNKIGQKEDEVDLDFLDDKNL